MVGHLGVLDDRGRPLRNGGGPAAPGLRFVGLSNPLKGLLLQINLDARAAARAIARELRRGLGSAAMAIDPRGADLKRYLQEDPGGPVVMLNLLRFAEGGRESYFRYARGPVGDVPPPLRRRGALRRRRRHAAGRRAGPGLGRRAAGALPLARGVQPHGGRPRVPGGHRLRTQALTEAVLQPTVPW